MALECTTACCKIMREGSRILLSPFASIGMILLAAGLGEFGPIVLLIGVALLLLYAGSGFTYEELGETANMPDNVVEYSNLVSIYNHKHKKVRIKTNSSRFGTLESDNEVEILYYNPVINAPVKYYKKLIRYCAMAYEMTCSILINSYAHMMANRLLSSTMGASHIILASTLGGIAAVGSCCSLFLPASVRDWLGPGSCLLGVLGAILWMCAGPAGAAIAPDPEGAGHRVAQLAVHMAIALYGIGGIEAPPQGAWWAGAKLRWLSAGRLLTLALSSMPGIIWYYSPTSTIAGVLTASTDAGGAAVARLCWIGGLIGTNLTVASHIYRSNRIRTVKWPERVSKAMAAIISPIGIALVNALSPATLPEIAHYTALVAGGIIIPFIAFLAPIIVYASDKMAARHRWAYRVFSLISTSLFVVIMCFAMAGGYAPSHLHRGLDYNNSTITTAGNYNITTSTAPGGYNIATRSAPRDVSLTTSIPEESTLFKESQITNASTNSWQSSTKQSLTLRPTMFSCEGKNYPLPRKCPSEADSSTLFEPCQNIGYSYNAKEKMLVFKHPTEGLLAILTGLDTSDSADYPYDLLDIRKQRAELFAKRIGQLGDNNTTALVRISTEEDLSPFIANYVTVHKKSKAGDANDVAEWCAAAYTPDNQFVVYLFRDYPVHVYRGEQKQDKQFTLQTESYYTLDSCTQVFHENIPKCHSLGYRLTHICKIFPEIGNSSTILYKPPNMDWAYMRHSFFHLPDSIKNNEKIPCTYVRSSDYLQTAYAYNKDHGHLRQLYKWIYEQNEGQNSSSSNPSCTVKDVEIILKTIRMDIKKDEEHLYLTLALQQICAVQLPKDG